MVCAPQSQSTQVTVSEELKSGSLASPVGLLEHSPLLLQPRHPGRGQARRSADGWASRPPALPSRWALGHLPQPLTCGFFSDLFPPWFPAGFELAFCLPSPSAPGLVVRGARLGRRGPAAGLGGGWHAWHASRSLAPPGDIEAVCFSYQRQPGGEQCSLSRVLARRPAWEGLIRRSKPGLKGGRPWLVVARSLKTTADGRPGAQASAPKDEASLEKVLDGGLR